jgi:hypothetical protein
MTADRSPEPFDDDFHRFLGQLLRHSREPRRKWPGGAGAGFLPVAHGGNRRLQFDNAIADETFRWRFLRARTLNPATC